MGRQWDIMWIFPLLSRDIYEHSIHEIYIHYNEIFHGFTLDILGKQWDIHHTFMLYIYTICKYIYICVYIQDMWGSDDDAHKIRLSDNDIFLVIMHVVMCRMKMPYLR